MTEVYVTPDILICDVCRYVENSRRPGKRVIYVCEDGIIRCDKCVDRLQRNKEKYRVRLVPVE